MLETNTDSCRSSIKTCIDLADIIKSIRSEKNGVDFSLGVGEKFRRPDILSLLNTIGVDFALLEQSSQDPPLFEVLLSTLSLKLSNHIDLLSLDATHLVGQYRDFAEELKVVIDSYPPSSPLPPPPSSELDMDIDYTMSDPPPPPFSSI